MLIVGDGLSNTVEKIGKMGRVWLRVEKINWRQPQTITLPVPPARELHAHRNGLQGPPQERSYRKAIHNTNRNNTKTPLRISWKYFTVCLRVQWKPSEEWKPFFQLNNGTVVQLKTCSAWLHSPTTSPDTATQSSGDSNKSFLWVQHFFHFSWEKVIFKVFLLIQKQVLFLSQLWAAATLLTSAMWPSCDAKSCFHTKRDTEHACLRLYLLCLHVLIHENGIIAF